MKHLASALAVSLLISLISACAASNKELKSHAKIPMAQAIQLAQAKVPGELIEARMAELGDRYLYQIQILDANKLARWVVVDASDGSYIERQTRPRLKY